MLPFKRYQNASKMLSAQVCSADAIYLLTSLTYVIVEANSADQDQQKSVLYLYCFAQALKTFKQMIKSEDFVVISGKVSVFLCKTIKRFSPISTN